MTRLEQLCAAIQHNEGFYWGSQSWRNNNPGNLRSSPFATDAKNGYARFASYASGWLALWWDVWKKCKGETRTGLTPSSKLTDLAEKWAPSFDRNNPSKYAMNIATQLNISINTQLSWFLEDIS